MAQQLNRTGTLKILAYTAASAASVLISSGLSVPVSAREQSQMQHPAGPPPTGPITSGFLQQPGYNPFAGLNTSGGKNGPLPGMSAPPGTAAPVVQGMGAVPGMGSAPVMGSAPGGIPGSTPGIGAPSFPVGGGANSIIQHILSTRIPTGTVLTGTLKDDLSSHKSEVGDLFSIVLQDGFFLNGVEVIPRNARIVGTVVNVKSASNANGMGMPGTMSIGLTTLVFPDGRSMPFGGNIDHNPAAIQKKPPKVMGSGFGIKQYGQQLSSMFGSFGSGIGAVAGNRNRGPEFSIKAGTMVPVRVNRTIDLTKLVAPSVPPATTAFGPSSAGGPADAAVPGAMSGANGAAPAAGNSAGNPTALQFPPTRSGQPILPRELPEPF